MIMFKYHLTYYDPFPYDRHYATSDWNEVLSYLERYGRVDVHVSGFCKNGANCPYKGL
mgnify:CR=1 FL=1